MKPHKEDIELRHEVLLAFQVALLGMVTPTLRGVNVEWDERNIAGVFVYEESVTEEEEEIVSETEGEVISHFSNHMICLKAIARPNSTSLEEFTSGVWVYRRLE